MSELDLVHVLNFTPSCHFSDIREMMPPIPRQITIPAAANTHTIPMVRQSMLIKELRINEVSGTQTNTMADMPANLKKNSEPFISESPISTSKYAKRHNFVFNRTSVFLYRIFIHLSESESQLNFDITWSLGDASGK